MKTLKKVPVIYEFVTVMNHKDLMEQGVIYISTYYSTSIHKCLCGCGNEVVTPLSPNDWSYTIKDDKLSMTPSILTNYPCGSHYIITNGVANFV